MKINTLFFDVGGVCLTDGWEYKSRQKAAKHFSLDFKQMEQQHQRIYKKYECGGMTLHQYLSQLVFYKKRKFSQAEFFYFIQGESKAYPSTLKILKRLKSNNRYLLVMLNNEYAELNDFRIKKFGLRNYFTHFFTSCFLGCRKPEPRIYEIALQVTQKKPKEILFIDDRKENIKTASTLNFNTIHLKNVKKLAQELSIYGIKY